MPTDNVMEKLVSLAKRRGFVFQSSEIYGGLGSVWDYGPLGVELKKNLKERWWRSMVHEREDIEGLDAAILMDPRWEESGTSPDSPIPSSLASMPEPLPAPTTQGSRHARTAGCKCPKCGMRARHRAAHVQFISRLHGSGEEVRRIYLRPETARGLRNYLNVRQSSRAESPGRTRRSKAFRKGHDVELHVLKLGSSRWRMQFFVKPGTDGDGSVGGKRMKWMLGWGAAEKLRFQQHTKDGGPLRRKLDIQYEFPFG